jgi:hypothetical protein
MDKKALKEPLKRAGMFVPSGTLERPGWEWLLVRRPSHYTGKPLRANDRCVDCGRDTLRSKPMHYYMATYALWYQVGAGNRMLCLGCLEARVQRDLGRNLTPQDITHVLWGKEPFGFWRHEKGKRER